MIRRWLLLLSALAVLFLPPAMAEEIGEVEETPVDIPEDDTEE